MTTHASPLGVSTRQAPPEGFTCYQPLEEEHPCSEGEDTLMWLGAMVGCIAFVLLAVHVWRVLA